MLGVYGSPPSVMIKVPAGSVQFSPLAPGAQAFEHTDAGSVDSIMMLAPAGTLERRYALAQAFMALKTGGTLMVMALNKKGGTRLSSELEYFGVAHVDEGRNHYRICECTKPATLTHVQEALDAGALQPVTESGLWSQPGVFSWNKVDVGSAMLAKNLPPLSGKGADLGSGIGFLALAALTFPKVEQLTLVEIDRRAVDAAKRNVTDPRAVFMWQDVREASLQGLDFVVMNPPFHDTGMEDHGLGQSFVQAAANCLRSGGLCYMVANRHLPYEATLKTAFKTVTSLGEMQGFKLYEARK
jgi:16S rRNA (guanine1207-N2)-methyltransferase